MRWLVMERKERIPRKFMDCGGVRQKKERKEGRKLLLFNVFVFGCAGGTDTPSRIAHFAEFFPVVFAGKEKDVEVIGFVNFDQFFGTHGIIENLSAVPVGDDLVLMSMINQNRDAFLT